MKKLLLLAVACAAFGAQAELSYIPLEYISSSGTEYIDTGVSGTSVYAFEMGMSVISVLDDTQTYLGTKKDHFVVCSKATGEKWVRFCERGTQRHANNTIVFTEGVCNHVAATNGVFSVNGSVLSTAVSTGLALSTDSSHVCIAALANGAKPSAMRIYWVKLYGSDGSLLADLVPAKTPGGDIGMYDLVSPGRFVGNAGSGTFGGGPATVALLSVRGEPVEYGTPVPGYGLSADFAVGQTARLEAPSSWASANDDIRAEVTGWTLEKPDGTTIEGVGNEAEFEFAEDMSGGILTWHWRQKYRVDVTTKNAVGGVSASAGSVWSDWDGTLSLTAPAVPSGADRFGSWDGAGITGANMLDPTAVGKVTGPGAVTATYVNRWTFDSSTGIATDGNWTLTLGSLTLNGVACWRVNSVAAGGQGVLDLTHFNEDTSEQKVIRGLNEMAFRQNAAITGFVAPDVAVVGRQAFEQASSLRLVVFSDAVTFNGYSHFHMCAALERLVPQAITNQTVFGARVFQGCVKLAQPFDCPNLTTINDHYFATSAGFTSFNAPKLRTITGADAFGGNRISGRIWLPEAERLVSSFSACPITEFIAPKCVDIGGLSNCAELTNVVLSAVITNIAGAAFAGCPKLAGFSPRQFKRLRGIGPAAFNGCSSLADGFEFLWKGTMMISPKAFEGCPHLTNVVFRTTVSLLDQHAFMNCNPLHLYFYQDTPPEMNVSDYDPSLPYYMTSFLHIANGSSSPAWLEWLANNAGATGTRQTTRDTNWSTMQAQGKVPEGCFGIVYFSFTNKYLFDWTPPVKGFQILVR